MTFKLKEVTEGATRLLVPVERNMTKKDPVFYNPEMELSRDLTILVASAAGTKRFCDLLAGSGARGVRVAKETVAQVLANDVNPVACDLMKKNMELNGLSIELCALDANRLLADHRFDYIDMDPFGSPAQFLESGIRAVDNKGIIAVTATDTAALCGTSPKACMRKYDSAPLRTDHYNELGLRILVGSIARTAMKHGKGIRPLFAHCTRHYFRVYAQVLRGSGKANATLENLGFLEYCPSCLYRGYSKLKDLRETCDCGGKIQKAGMMWTGTFADQAFCEKMEAELSSRKLGKAKEAGKLIENVKAEQTVTIPYYDVHKIAKRMGIQVKPREQIKGYLEAKGYKTVKTHYSDLGLRTDAPLKDLYDSIK